MSEQSMVERVARAIEKSEPPEHYLVSWQAYLPVAFAAIAAMREPTRRVSRAGQQQVVRYSPDDSSASMVAEKTFQAMIDAALVESH